MPVAAPRTGNADLPAGVVERLARAVASDRAGSVAHALAVLGKRGAFDEHALYAAPDAARYSRRSLWRDPAGRFAVVSMTWLPGQGTPVHDHAGRWGAELVVSGVMRETTYRIVARGDDGRLRLDAAAPVTVGAREVGAIVPTVDVHAFHNAGSRIARTVHVYSTLRDACTIFAAGDDGWWSARRIDLTTDV
jgi:predicted metal-dependent enzyme (double-stranded beta helix superfamily)